MLYRFLLLGQIPGTNIQLTFYQILAIIFVGLCVAWLRHYYPGLPQRLRTRLSRTVYTATAPARLISSRLRH